jgi:hypothetical protein
MGEYLDQLKQQCAGFIDVLDGFSVVSLKITRYWPSVMRCISKCVINTRIAGRARHDNYLAKRRGLDI